MAMSVGNIAIVIFQSSLAGLGELIFINPFPEMKFLGYYQMSRRDKIPNISSPCTLCPNSPSLFQEKGN
jgi:hypothetical protein